MTLNGTTFKHDQEVYSYTLVPTMSVTSVTEYTYILNFSGQGASTTPYRTTSTNSTITIDLSQFTPETTPSGATFVGWALIEGAGISDVVSSITIVHNETTNGEATVYAVWSAAATLIYRVTVDGLNGGNESIDDANFSLDSGGATESYTLVQPVALGQSYTWNIISSQPTRVAGVLNGEQVDTWAFGGWTIGSAVTPAYASQAVTGNANPFTTISVNAGDTVILTPNWVRGYTKSVTFMVTSTIKIVNTYTDAISHTHGLNGYVPTSLETGDVVYEYSNGSWVQTTVSAITAVRNANNFIGWSTNAATVIQVAQSTLTLENSAGQNLVYYAIYRPTYALVVEYHTSVSDPTPVASPTGTQSMSLGVRYLPGQEDETYEGTSLQASLTDTIPTSQTGIFKNWKKVVSGSTTDPLSPTTTTISVLFTKKGDQAITLVLVPEWTNSWTVYLRMSRFDNEGTQVGTTVDYPGAGLAYSTGTFGSSLVVSSVSDLVIPGLEAGSDQNMWKCDSVYRGSTAVQTYVPDTDTLTFTPTTDMGASITLDIKYVYATYMIRVSQGENSATIADFNDNPDEPGYFSHTTSAQDGSVWTKSVTYTGQEFETSLEDFAGSYASSLVAGGAKAFMGFARRVREATIYPAGEYTDAYRFENNSYPAEGDIVDLIAVWGTFATRIDWLSTSYLDNGVLAVSRVTPSDAADGRVTLAYEESVIYTTDDSTGRGVTSDDLVIESSTQGLDTQISVQFKTPGRYALVFVPVAANPEATTPTATIDAVYTKVEFLAYTDSEDVAAILPESLEWTAGSAQDFTVDLAPYSASAGLIHGGRAVFGGWTDDEDNGNDYLRTLTVTAGTYTPLYALWKMDITYVLNGGEWHEPQKMTVYRTIKAGLEDIEQEVTVALTSGVPVHPTKSFSAWVVWNSTSQTEVPFVEGTTNEIPFQFGLFTARASWVVENLKWAWGSYAVEYLPADQVPTDDGNSANRGLVRPTFTWTDQLDTWGIEFNTEYNVPSHITDITIPLAAMHVVDLCVIGPDIDGELLIWDGSYLGTSGEDAVVYIDENDLPKLVTVDGSTDPVIGRIWVRNDQGEYIECVPVEGLYTIPVGEAAETKIYLRTDALWDVAGVTATFDIIDSDLSYGVGTMLSENVGEWLNLSNKNDHQFYLNIPDKLYTAETYKLQADDYGTWFFRRIHENWITTSANWYPVSTYVPGENDTAGTFVIEQRYGLLRTSVRADAGYYAVALSAHPELTEGDPTSRVEKMYVILIHITDDMPDAPLCKLSKYVSANSDYPEELYLSTSDQPNLSITSITRGFKAQLNQSPMLTKSSQFNYIIDLGNVETLTMTVTRTQPAKVIDDDTLGNDPANWSNGKWMSYVKQYFDQWQNANYNADKQRSGGYNLIFDPVVDYNGYPKLDKNVFLSAPLTYKFDRALVNLTLQFTVASMLGRQATQAKCIYYHYLVGPEEEEDSERILISKTYTDEFVVPDIPPDAYEDTDGNSQIGWQFWINQDGIEDSKITYPGDTWPSFLATMTSAGETSEVVHMYAFYATRKISFVITGAETLTTFSLSDYIESGENDESAPAWIKVLAVGGGGGGGSSRCESHMRGTRTYYDFRLGGGGGSGYVKRRFTHITSANHQITVSIGKGAGSEASGTSTKVIIDDNVFAMAPGGGGGGRTKPGIGGHNGGEHVSGDDMYSYYWRKLKGNNGAPVQVTENLGIIGGPGTDKSSGGGAAEINKVLVGTNAAPVVWYENGSVQGGPTTVMRVKSIGGSCVEQTIPAAIDGGEDTIVPPRTAKYGGGGCSSMFGPNQVLSNHTRTCVNPGDPGADGVAIIEFYS